MAESHEHTLHLLQQQIVECRRCPELREYCFDVARSKRRSFAEWNYWGKPVPAFGDAHARIMIVGLAPAAHGANRTGRMFTGDRSGDFLYAALHRAGLANQPTSIDASDGLALRDVYITAAARCAPPANKPTPAQLRSCEPYLVREIELIQPRVIICLGAIGWNAALSALTGTGVVIPRPRPRFAHGCELDLERHVLLGCYHVSQQNTFTGKLTPRMLDAVVARAKRLGGLNAREAASGDGAGAVAGRRRT